MHAVVTTFNSALTVPGTLTAFWFGVCITATAKIPKKFQLHRDRFTGSHPACLCDAGKKLAGIIHSHSLYGNEQHGTQSCENTDKLQPAEMFVQHKTGQQ